MPTIVAMRSPLPRLFLPALMAACAAFTLVESGPVPERTALTLYNDGTGFVSQTMRATLATGTDVEWVLSDLAATLEAPTVRLVSLTDAAGLAVREQNFEYDLVNPQKLMERYLGETVGFEVTDPATGSVTRLEGLVLSNAGQGVFEIDGEIHLGAPGRIVLPSLPGGLALKPQLRWRLANTVEGPQDLRLSYLMSGTSWWADYTLHIADGAADLVGWVTLRNQSGTGYTEAEVKLVAGSVHRAPSAPVMRGGGVYAAMDMVPEVAEEAFFEYHLYTLPGTTDLPDRSLKQVRFLEGVEVPVERVYTLANPWGWAGPTSEAGDPQPVPIEVTVEFDNSEAAGLGLPLPAGTVRLFMADSAGDEHLVGEDRVRHTPREERVRLRAGQAFDVVGEVRTKDFRKLYGNRTETDVEVRIRNRKEETVTVRYRAQIWGDVEVRSASLWNLRPVGNGWWEALVTAAPDEEAVLAYTVTRN